MTKLSDLSPQGKEAAAQLYSENTHTGIIDGGAVTINELDSTKIDVAAGNGIIVDSYTDYNKPVITEVSWEATTVDILDPSLYAGTYVYVDETGTVLTDATTDIRKTLSRIELSFVQHFNNEAISVFGTYTPVGTLANSVIGLIDQMTPTINGGYVVPSAGDMSFIISDIVFYNQGTNWVNDRQVFNGQTYAGQNPCSFRYMYQTGDYASDITTQLDPSKYNFEGNALSNVPNRGVTIQYLYATPIGDFIMLYGQRQYSTLNEAASALSQDLRALDEPDILRSSIRMYAILVKGNANEATNDKKISFIRIVEGVAITAFPDDDDPVVVGSARLEDSKEDNTIVGTKGTFPRIQSEFVPEGNSKEVVAVNTSYISSGAEDINAEPITSGIVSGGKVTIDEVDKTLCHLAAGTGVIVDSYTDYSTTSVTEIEWEAQSFNILNPSTTSGTYVTVNVDGDVVLSNTKPSYTTLDEIDLVFIQHSMGESKALSVMGKYQPVGISSNLLYQYLKLISPIVQGGVILTTVDSVEIGISDMSVISIGLAWGTNPSAPHHKNFPGVSTLQFKYMTMTGLTSAEYTTEVEAKYYNPEGDTIARVTDDSNTATIQYLFLLPDVDEYVMLYGQTEYKNSSQALDALHSDIQSLQLPEILNNAIMLYSFSLEEDTDNLQYTGDALISRVVNYNVSAVTNANSFITMPDTPLTYTEQGGKFLAVADTELSVEFVDGVESVFGETGNVRAEFGTYSTDLIESTRQPGSTLTSVLENIVNLISNNYYATDFKTIPTDLASMINDVMNSVSPEIPYGDPGAMVTADIVQVPDHIFLSGSRLGENERAGFMLYEYVPTGSTTLTMTLTMMNVANDGDVYFEVYSYPLDASPATAETVLFGLTLTPLAPNNMEQQVFEMPLAVYGIAEGAPVALVVVRNGVDALDTNTGDIYVSNAVISIK